MRRTRWRAAGEMEGQGGLSVSMMQSSTSLGGSGAGGEGGGRLKSENVC